MGTLSTERQNEINAALDGSDTRATVYDKPNGRFGLTLALDLPSKSARIKQGWGVERNLVWLLVEDARRIPAELTRTFKECNVLLGIDNTAMYVGHLKALMGLNFMDGRVYGKVKLKQLRAQVPFTVPNDAKGGD